MKSRNLFCAALLIVIAGCASAPRAATQTQPKADQKASACHGQHCTITVTVSSGCVVKVDPYFIVMTGPGPVTMTWKTSGGVTFASNAIRWKTPGAGQVFQPGSGGPQTVTVVNNRSQKGIFHYGVTVLDGGTACPELDPTGIND